VDTVITNPNERLLSIIDRHTSLNDSFSMADDVLRQAIQGISDLILVPGLINLDFADVKTIMSGMGVAMMGTGTAEGENRAMQAAQKAIASPLLEDGSVHGARGVIINVTGGPDLSLMEVNEASCVIQEAAHEDANIIFGAVVDPSLKGKVKITVIATGFERKGSNRGVPAAALQTPVDLHSYTAHLARPAEPAAVEQPMMEMDAPQLMEVAAPPLTVSRRASLHLPLPLAPSPNAAGEGADGLVDFDADLSSPLDVPAFLRRKR
jgi:cell division protein FtsZ